ncbi:alpha/beta fold hydrolase [Bacillus sp. CLL-7-23]|uniref:Alpha/beta fold hydrolase n=1 Tax=Bacillus changyiensis TaxID=3004103 RepID=A0ABT4X7C1_9BACI|nr:alpha/beta fold hydrolase [Bacillus changyiensis]MDA7028189.1 alpha/beta fold hydrolase [Bacillus changyiensis]
MTLANTFSKAKKMFYVLQITDFCVHPDETQLVFHTNLNGKPNIWAMDLSYPYPYQLTFFDQNCNGMTYSKDGSFIFAGFDQDGNEQHRLYQFSSSGEEPQLLNGNQQDRHFQPNIVNHSVYYTSSKDNPVFLNTYQFDLLTRKEKLIFTGNDGVSQLSDVSPNEKVISFLVSFVNSHSICVIQTADGHITPIVPDHNKTHKVYSSYFLTDNILYVTTNYDSEFSYLASYTISSNTFTPLLLIDKTDLTSIHADPNGKYLYLIGKKGVKDIIYQYEIRTGEAITICCPCPSVKKVCCTKSGALYLLGSTPSKPDNIYVKKAHQTEWCQLTKHGVPGFSEEELTDPEVITYRSFDGRTIEGLLYKSSHKEANGWTIIWPHGGPQYAEQLKFYDIFQIATKMGYQVFAPNFRGSENYGYTFYKMVERDWGDGPRLDMITGIDWLIDQKIADREKLFLLGGSYGGYMALLLHGRHPEYFQAVVDICGVSNLFTFVKSVPEFWRPHTEKWVRHPDRDRIKMTADSPITYLNQMTRPMLVVQGKNDPRVVKEESDQVVDQLKKWGREIEYLIMEDEGHGFSKRESKVNAYTVIFNFFEKHRLKSPVRSEE